MPQKSHLPGHLDSIRSTLRPKHQLLVLKCYPRLPRNSTADVRPNGSELSYLVYYASTRKSKLHKLGLFLDKKAAADVAKAQSARVAVTLHILTALLENKSIGASAAFPLFAPYVLRILREILLNGNDVTLVEASLPTWDAFCRHQDQATLAADHEYRQLYQHVVARYVAFAAKDGKKTLGKTAQPVAVQDAIRLRKAGLGALKSVLVSDALASEAGRQLDLVIPAVLGNMRGEDEVYLEHLLRVQKQSEEDEKQRAIDRRQSMATVRTSTNITNDGDADPRTAAGTAQDADDLAEEQVAVLALECLKATFATDNRAQIRTATSAVLRYDAKMQTDDGQPGAGISSSGLSNDTWATKLFEMCTSWTAVQDRFILMVTTVETLVRLPLKECDLHQHLLYTALVDQVLRSDLNLIGLSIMDVLLSLIQQILRVLQLSGPRVPGRNSVAQLFSSDEESKHPDAAEASEKPIPNMPSEARIRLIARLKNCIADLGTHVYYTDQITDMLAAILMRLKPNPTPTPGQQNPLATAAAIEEPQSAVLETASNVSLSARQRSGSTSASGFFSFDTARQIALEAVRDVLVVANHGGARRSVPTILTSTPEGIAESRHKVPLAVWEGTQWLLRDPAPEVRKAYVDALVTWLRLETIKQDARIKEPKQKTPKKDSVVARRAVSNASRKGREGVIGGQTKKVTNTFLSLLHLAAYENALQFALAGSPEAEREMALLHLLLTTLTQKLGVNAVQSGLPMIFTLQDEIAQMQRDDQKIRLGSLVLGYVWAVDDTFELDVTTAGRELFKEITKRRDEGIWLKEIGVPPADLQQIAELDGFTPTKASESAEIAPFSSRQTLVDLIADAYASTLATSPPTSAPGSPGRTFSNSGLERSNTNSYLAAKQTPNSPTVPASTKALPDKVKMTMLEPWSKETCLAAIAANAPKSVSLSGSRSSPGKAAHHLSLGVGNHRQLLAAANTPGASRNQSGQREQHADGSRSRSPDRGHRGASTPSRRAPGTSSSARKATVGVEDLKKILNGEAPSMPFSFGSRSVVDDTASESLVDDEGFDEDKSQDIGFATPPQRTSQPADGNEGAPPVLQLPKDTFTEGQFQNNSTAPSPGDRNGNVNALDQSRAPPSRGGASMRSTRSSIGTKTKAQRRADVKALLEGMNTADTDERAAARRARGEILAGIERPD